MARDRDHDSVATITPLSHSYKGDKKHKKKKSRHDEERESSKHSELKKDRHRHESHSSRNSDGKSNHKSKKDKHEDIRREGSSESRSKEHKKRKREKSRESDGREGYGSKTESPHKKERKEYVVKVEVENDNEESLDDTTLLQNEWTYEDEAKLVETMKEQVPVNDIKSHRLTLKKMDWEAVSTKLTHTAAECEEKWKEIMGFLVLLKPLGMLLSEAEVELKTTKRRRLRIAKPYGRFLKEYCAKNSFKGQGIVLSKGTEAWKNLDPRIKKQYYDRYYQELQEAGIKDKQMKAANGPTPVLGPFDIFLNGFDVNDSLSKKDRRNNARTVWVSLPVAKKVEYIEKSFEDLKRYQKEVEEYKAEHPEWTAPKHRGPVKEHINLYLEYHGLPSVPQSSPAMLLLNELGEEIVDGQESDGKKRLILAHQKFKEMTEDEKEVYRKKLELLWKDYKSQLEQWKQKADRHVLEIAEKYFKEKKEPKIVKARRATKNPKSAVGNGDDEEIVESSLLTVKFIGEPPKPPASGYRLFFTRFMKQSPLPVNERMRQVGSYWEKLTEDQKDCYERKAKECKESFCKEILDYVEGLSEEHKKMYIGTKRRYFRKFFGRDPFAEDYPTSLYPVFVRSPKKKTTNSKVQNKPAVVKKKDQVVKKEDSDNSDESSSDDSKGRQDDDDDEDEDSSEEESEESEDTKEHESQSRTPVTARSSGLSQLIKHTNNQNSSDSSDSDSSSDESSDGEDNEGNNDEDEEQEDDDEEEEEEDEKEDPVPVPPVKTPTVPKHSRKLLSPEKTYTNSISKSVSSPKTMNSSAKPTVNADSSSSDESDNSSEANSSDEDSEESVDDVAPAWHNQSTSAKLQSREQQQQEDSESDSSESY